MKDIPYREISNCLYKEKNRTMASKIFKKVIDSIPPEKDAFIRMSVEIVKRVNELMQSKGMNQAELATALEKSPSEVSKWLSGMHNFTLKSIAKLEVILGAPVLTKAVDKAINEDVLLERIEALKKELLELEMAVGKR